MNIAERIKKLRKSLSLNQAEFGARIGIKQSTVTGYETGIRVPLDSVIVSICKEYNVNENWLRYGNGEMFLEKDTDQEFAEAINQINYHGDELIKKIIIDYMHLNEENKKKAKQYILDLAAAVKKDKSI